MNSQSICIFALDASRPFGEQVCAKLNISLGEHEVRDFEDGEHKSRPLVNVRRKDVFVIHSLYSEPQQSVNDKLCRLLFFIGALKDASAERVTVVMPYLCYARKDMKTKDRDPVTSRYVAALLEAAGADRAVTMDVHNLAAFQNGFRRPTDHLEARKMFVNYFASLVDNKEVIVVSPDTGGIKRAEKFRLALSRALSRDVGSAFMEKFRSKGIVTGGTLVGDVAGRTAIIIDDLISSGTTIARTVSACHKAGATHIYAAATHGMFVGQANSLLADEALEKVVITDTIPPFRLTADSVKQKVVVLETSALVAEAIKRIHTGGSIVELLAT